ncbi:MAG: rhodanese-like domain-containing protein, partial [candidate division FCPU426 bacterium]
RGNEDPVPPAGAEIDVHTLKQWQDEKRKFVLLDVREPNEYEIANLGGKLIPLGSLAASINQLDSADEIVVHCKMGGRSARAQAMLNKFGFKKVFNLEGGIDAWSAEIDPSLPRY